MKNRKNYPCLFLKASFTLEAAIIFPIILAVILYILLLVFSLHDATATKALSYRYLISYSMKIQNIYSYNNKAIQNINNEAHKESILNNPSNLFVKSEKNKLKVISSSYDIPTVFSNYNHTEALWAYKAGKTLFDKSDKIKTVLP